MHVLEALLMYQNVSGENSTYHRMCRTILDNLDKVRQGTIYDTAELCYTSTTSVGRFCTRLGYSSYSSFRAALADALEDYTFSDYVLEDLSTQESSIPEMQQALVDVMRRQTDVIAQISPEILDQMVQLLVGCSSAHFFTPMLDPCSILSLQTSLTLTGKPSFLHHDTFSHDHGAVKTLQPTDIAFFVIPNHQRWSHMTKLFQQVRDLGCATVLLSTKDKPQWVGATVKLCMPGGNSIMDSRMYEAIFDLLSCIYRRTVATR